MAIAATASDNAASAALTNTGRAPGDLGGRGTMARLRWLALNGLTVLSFTLCVATCYAWGRSLAWADRLEWVTVLPPAGPGRPAPACEAVTVVSAGGWVGVRSEREDYVATPPPGDGGPAGAAAPIVPPAFVRTATAVEDQSTFFAGPADEHETQYAAVDPDGPRPGDSLEVGRTGQVIAEYRQARRASPYWPWVVLSAALPARWWWLRRFRPGRPPTAVGGHGILSGR